MDRRADSTPINTLGGASRYPGLARALQRDRTATGIDHGTIDIEAEVAACLALAKLGIDDVEIVSDASPVVRFTA